MIDSFSGEYFFLSNFYPSPFLEFQTVEHYFQAAKTNIPSEKYSIINAPTPGKAKRLGRKVTLRKDWEEVKFQVMLEGVRYKFSFMEELASKLLDTEDSILMEGNYWHDNVWGNCTCEKCKNIEGENWLGKILMMVRKELKEGEF